MDFPQMVSFTVTNTCNLRCKMCGQWSEQGYIAKDKEVLKQQMELDDWKRLVDEISEHHISSVLVRGGEPFMFPGIINLLEYIHSKGIFISIDTNGTLLKQYAADLLRIGNIHITVSIDGPEEIHDQVRGVTGCFRKIEEGLLLLNEFEKSSENKISRSICFTISPYSVRGLGEMPNVARHLHINTLCIVPYNYIPTEIGKQYETVLKEHFACKAFTWQGFQHDDSGIDFEEFHNQYQKFFSSLGNIYCYPYLPLSIDEYKLWFHDAKTPVKSFRCSSIEKLIDIQPTGDVNFCVDMPDYVFGNVRASNIEALWNNEHAEKFRAYRRKEYLGACYRCVSKYMSEPVNT